MGDLTFAGGTANLADRRTFAGFLGPLRAVDWVVYAKRPFAGAEQVLEYLGRRPGVGAFRFRNVGRGQRPILGRRRRTLGSSLGAALLLGATALQVFFGRNLTPLSEPLPFFAYPMFVLTLFGWAWWCRTAPRR